MTERNISIAKVNGYTVERVKLAKKYLDEIGKNKRNFPFDRLVAMYNEVLNTNETADGCKCNAPKYYNGISAFYNFGKLTLLANNIIKDESELNDEEIVKEKETLFNEEERLVGVVKKASESVSEEEPTVIKEEDNKAVKTTKNTKRKKK